MLGIKPGVRSPNATSVLCRPPNQTQTLINCQLPGQNGPWHQVASTKLPVAIVLVFSQLAPVVKVPNAPVWIYLYKKNLAEFWQIILPCLACIGCTKDVIDKLQASCLMAKYGVGGGGSIAQWQAYLLPDPAAMGSIPIIPEIFSEERIVDVAEVN